MGANPLNALCSACYNALSQDYFNGYRADIRQYNKEQFGQFHGRNTNSSADKKEVDLYRGISDLNIVSTNPKRESKTLDYNYRRARSKRGSGRRHHYKKIVRTGDQRPENHAKAGSLKSRLPSELGGLKSRLPSAIGGPKSRLPSAIGGVKSRLPSVVGGFQSRLPHYEGPNVLHRTRPPSFADLKRLPQPGAPSSTDLKRLPRPGAPSFSNLKRLPRPGSPSADLKRLPRSGARSSADLKRLPQPGAPSFSDLKRLPRPGAPSSTDLKRLPRPRPPSFSDLRHLPWLRPPSITGLKRLTRPRPPSFSDLKRVPRPRPPSVADLKGLPRHRPTTFSDLRQLPWLRPPSITGLKRLTRPRPPSSLNLKRLPRPRPASFTDLNQLPWLRPPSFSHLKRFPRLRPPSLLDLKRLPRPRPASFSDLKQLPRPRPPSITDLKRLTRPRPPSYEMPLEPEMLPGPLSPSDYGKRQREMRRRPSMSRKLPIGQEGKSIHKFEMHHNIKTIVPSKYIPHRFKIRKQVIENYVPNQMKHVPAVRPMIELRPIQVGAIPVLTEEDFHSEPMFLDTKNTATKIKLLLRRIKNLFVAGLNITKELKKTLFVNSELNHNLCLRQIQELEHVVGQAPGDNQPIFVGGIETEIQRTQSISNKIFNI
ncbi:hypothetical protein TNCT_690531 [Trichonephila clavata]|uniref:Uncharacterized protein n=1 Tax=Trichonephila clavata TaxID=2740835 RepID=A0A8X6J8P5_TRICU|nr:hypothetical protein TNCT_690531 [Trichonephila clavata]